MELSTTCVYILVLLGAIAFAMGRLDLLCLCNLLDYCSCNYFQIALKIHVITYTYYVLYAVQ